MANHIEDNGTKIRPIVTVISGPNVDIDVVEMKGAGFEMRLARTSEHTVFAGIAENDKFNQLMAKSKMREDLLLRAVNNRTRERNYYILYSRLADGEITEEEFDKLLDEYSEKYVIDTDIQPTLEEFNEAYSLSTKIMDAESIGTLETLFSFDEEATIKVCKGISDGSL